MSKPSNDEDDPDLRALEGPGSDRASDDGWEYDFSYSDGEEDGYEYEDVRDEDGAYVIGENGFVRRRRKIPLS